MKRFPDVGTVVSMMQWFRHESGELSERETAESKTYREPGNMHARTSEISRTRTPERSAAHTPESSADRQVTTSGCQHVLYANRKYAGQNQR